MYYNNVFMKKQYLVFFQLSLLLTSCNNSQTTEEIKKLDFDNQIEVYKILNSTYNSNYVDYEKITTGSIKSTNKGIGPDYYSRFLKNYKSFYEEETFKASSSMYNVNEASLRYEDYETSTFGNTTTDTIDDTTLIQGLNYSALEYNSLEDYTNIYGNTLKSITPYIINEDEESKSFSGTSKKENGDIYELTYHLNTENTKKGGEYVTIDAFKPVMNRYLEYFSSLADSSSYSVNDVYFTIYYSKSNNSIEKITRFEEFSISKLTFKGEFTTTFNLINNKEYSDPILSLKERMDKIVEESSDKALLEIYNFYLDLNEKYKSKNYYSVTSGTANALGGMYSQTILGYKLKNDDDIFFTTITTSAFVKSAESRFHNLSNDSYKIGKGNDPKSNGKYGSVSKWEEMKDYSKENYLSTIGHTMEGLTNFTINESNLEKSFTKAKTYKENDMYVYSYSVSFTDSDKYEDVSKGYKIEMNHMSNMGLPTFSKLEFNIYLDSTKENIIKITNHEEYQTGGFGITSDMTNEYYTFNSLSEVPSEITSTYQKLIK